MAGWSSVVFLKVSSSGFCALRKSYCRFNLYIVRRASVSRFSVGVTMFRLWSIWQISVIWIWIVILILGALLVNVVTLGFIARPFLCPWLRFYGRSILKLCRIEWEVEGMGHFSDDGPAIVVFNHTSLLDMFLLTAIAPDRVTYVLKRELLFSKMNLISPIS